MKTILALLMTISISACSSNGSLRDSSREIGRHIGKDVGQLTNTDNRDNVNRQQNNGKGPYGPGRAS